MWRGPVVVAALACASCIKLAPFAGGHDAGDSGTTMIDAPTSSSAVMAVPDGNGALVTGPHFAVHFANIATGSNGFGYPDSVKIDGVEMLDSNSPYCNDETLSGIALYPSFRAAPLSTQKATTNTVKVDLAGPGVAKVAVTWTATFSCGSVTRSPMVRSTFTIFDDGRVHRHDALTDTGAPAPDMTNCSCDTAANAGEWAIGSYVLLARPITPDGFMLPTDTSAGTNAASTTVCSGHANEAFGLATFTGAIRVRSPNVTANAALIYDLDSFNATLPTYQNPIEGHTIWWLAPGSCDAIFLPLVNENMDFQLDGDIANSGYAARGRASDGIFGGEEAAGTGYPADDTSRYRATAGFTLPPGQAIWLRFQGPRSQFSITRTTGDTGWYETQQPAPDQLVIHVKDQITNSNIITVMASP